MINGICSKLKDCCDAMFGKKEKKENEGQIDECSKSKRIPLLDLAKSPNESFSNKISTTPTSKTKKVSLNDFRIIKTLGKGAFGKVILVYNNDLKKYFAMKTLKKDFIKKNKQITHTKTEREILEKIENYFSKLGGLIEAALDPNVNKSLLGSIELCRFVGVAEKQIIHNTSELDDFMLS